MAMQQDRRYELLQSALEKALDFSHKSLDIEKLVRETYDADDQNNQVFGALLQSMLDQVHSKSKAELLETFRDEQVEQKLFQFQAAVTKIQRDEERKRKEEEKDQQSAAAAVAQTRNQTDSPSRACRRRMYKDSMEKKAALEAEIEEMERDVAELKARMVENTGAAAAAVGELRAEAKAKLLE